MSPAVERIAALQSLEREVGVLMRRTRRVVRERAMMLHPELSAPSYLMLSFIKGMGPSRASDIAEAFQLDKGAVSRSVHSLLELGLIEKESDPEDRRAMILSITPYAASRLDEIAAQRLERLESLLDEWSAQDIEDFVSGFERYNQLLEASLVATNSPLAVCD